MRWTQDQTDSGRGLRQMMFIFFASFALTLAVAAVVWVRKAEWSREAEAARTCAARGWSLANINRNTNGPKYWFCVDRDNRVFWLED